MISDWVGCGWISAATSSGSASQLTMSCASAISSPTRLPTRWTPSTRPGFPPGDKPGRVLGVHLVGSRVGELIAEAQLIVNWDAEPDDVAALIHPHPTQSEIIGEAHLALAGKPLHFHA